MWQAILASCLITVSVGETCKVISLEGGGSHGAFEAGALWELVNNLPADDVKWDVVTGISTGALNAGAMGQYGKGDEKAMADFVVDTWLTLGGSGSIYKNWPGGIANGLIFQKGLYDTTPLKETIDKKLKSSFKREMIVGATNLNDGKFYNFDQTYTDPRDAIRASAAPPFFFPYVITNNTVFSDGGYVINLDVFVGITRCLELNGNKPQDIVVDMLFDNKINTISEKDSFSVLGVYNRMSAINGYESSIWYLNNAMEAYPLTNFRYIVTPSESMPGGIVPLNFDQDVLEQSVQLGKDDAKKVLQEKRDSRELAADLLRERQQSIIYIS